MKRILILALISGLYLSACTCPEPKSDPPVIDPKPIQSKVQVLDTWERPEFANPDQWKPAITRTLMDGQVTSVVLKSDAPCELVSVPGIHVIVPVELTKPSAPSYAAGTYYDALRPLTSDNCESAKYLQLDVSESVQIGDAKVMVQKKATKAPAIPALRLHAAFDNWEMVKGYCGNKWCAAESRWVQGAELLAAHRVEPYSAGEIQINKADYLKVTHGYPMVSQALGGQPPTYALPSEGWAYVLDEPHYESDVPRLEGLLKAWQAKAPGVKRLVTTPLRWKNLTVGSSTFAKTVPWPKSVGDLIDIHVVVAEEFCQETWKSSGDRFPCREEYAQAGKEVWLYVSNMSHGATNGPATGAPDLVIDARGGAVEAFGFFLAGTKYDFDGLLYYNTIQDWGPNAETLIVNPWTRGYDGADLGGAGDGLLLYADVPNKSALPSMRLKLIREASQWADAIQAANLETKAAELMRSTVDWDRDLSKFETLHREAMENLR